MSEYITINVEYNDAECIKVTLKEMGYVFEEHNTEQSLYGYHGDARSQKAHIIIRRQHVGAAANDVGFRKTSNGNYEIIISEYDQRQGSKSAENFLTKMRAIYTKHKHLKQLKKMGKTITSVKTTADGKIKIKAIM